MAVPGEQLIARRSLDVSSIRRDFPLLQGGTPAERLHYLDSAATTQKPNAVLEAMDQCYRQYYSSIHRGLYPLAEEATRHYEQARRQLAGFIGAQASDIIFTRSATESINLVATGWALTRLNPGDIIWVSRMEHHANYLPWQRICQLRGAELRLIELAEDGRLDLAACKDLYSTRTRLIALCQVSNVLGIENPVREVCSEARNRGIAVLVDAAQSVSHIPIDTRELDCDFLAFSAHKMYGPAGIGLLFATEQRQQELEPLLLGGGMVDRVGEGTQPSHWIDGPARYEAGSPNLPGAVGFAAAAGYLGQFDREQVQQHLHYLCRYAREALQQVPGVHVLPLSDDIETSLLSFVHKDVHPHDIAQIAGEHGVAIRAGHHCAQPLLRSLDLVSTARASFGIYNDTDDIDALVLAIDKAQQLFGLD